MTAPEELPVSGTALAASQGLASTVRGLSGRYGVDWFDDEAVREMLSAHRASLARTSRGPAVWIAALALTAGVILLLWAVARRPEPDELALAVGPPAALVVAAAVGLLALFRSGIRKLQHPQLDGYRQVLAAALAHGVPVADVPDWLSGRAGNGKEWAPLPGAGPRPKRRNGEEDGGWHDEVGWLLILAGFFGTWWAHDRGQPLAYAAVLLVALGAAVLIAGYRRGRGK